MSDRGNPILAELDQIRLDMYREFDGDIHALFEYLRARESAGRGDAPGKAGDPRQVDAA